MHPLYGPLPVPYVPVLITRRAVIAHRYTYSPPPFRTSQYRPTFMPLSVSLWKVYKWRRVRWCGTGGFQEKSSANFYYWSRCSLTFCLLLFSPFLRSFYKLVLYGWGLLTDRVLISLSQPCITKLFE